VTPNSDDAAEKPDITQLILADNARDQGAYRQWFEERQGADAETLRTLAKKYHSETVGRRSSERGPAKDG